MLVHSLPLVALDENEKSNFSDWLEFRAAAFHQKSLKMAMRLSITKFLTTKKPFGFQRTLTVISYVQKAC